MSRKLRNSLNALVVTAALCATGAFAVAAVPFTEAVASHGPTVAATAGSSPTRAGATRRIRHQLAMPYFSFLPRG